MRKTRFDSYVNFSENKYMLSENCVFENAPALGEKVLNNLKRGGSIEKITFIGQVDEIVRKTLRDAFGKVYTDDNDSYVIIVSEKEITVHADSERGLIYAVYALQRNYIGGIGEGILYNSPLVKVRGARIYLPAREDFAFFKEWVDLLLALGYNTVDIEVGGAMEYKRHPEINEKWEEFCDMFYNGETTTAIVQDGEPWLKNSIHVENARGKILTQDEVRELVAYLKERHFEVIPEVPTLSHSDYLLLAHPELSEREEKYPDTYCPSNPDSYKLVFDVLDEVVDVFEPQRINIGHDENYTMGICEKCKGKNGAELFASDVLKIYNYLKQKGVGIAIWCEKLMNVNDTLFGKTTGGSERFITPEMYDGKSGYIPPTYPAAEFLPKDIHLFNWRYLDGEHHEKRLVDLGYKVYFGNFGADCMLDAVARTKRNNIQGYYVSEWGFINEQYMQRNCTLARFAYAAMYTWDPEFQEFWYEKNIHELSEDFCLVRNYDLLVNPHLEITHACEKDGLQGPFYCGDFIDEEKDYLGYYKICYQDGSEDQVHIYNNLNINNKAISYNRILQERFRFCVESDYRLFTPLGFCKYEKYDDGTYYTLSVATKGKKVSDVVFKPKENSDNEVYVKKIKEVE